MSTPESADRPLLEILSERAIEKYRQDESEDNGVETVTHEVISELTIPAIDILKELATQTQFNPGQLQMEIELRGPSWDSYFLALSKLILQEEMEARYPETQDGVYSRSITRYSHEELYGYGPSG